MSMRKQGLEDPVEVTGELAARNLHAPTTSDNKYTRSVVQLATGSRTYPGAAMLSVSGALSAGATLCRYVGPSEARRLILASAPEVVMAKGWFHAGLVGCGFDEETRESVLDMGTQAGDRGAPLVIDAGAIPLWEELGKKGARTMVLTPHAGEAAGLWRSLDETQPERLSDWIEKNPVASASTLADLTGAIIVLKGSRTVIASPAGEVFSVRAPSAWAGTAGSGDILAGVIVAIVASRHTEDLGEVAEAAATGAYLHAIAGGVASGTTIPSGEPTGSAGRPIVASQIAAALPQVIQAVLDTGQSIMRP